uniref:Novel immune-type receptor 12 n=1 Tax=Sinocyclocheilus grahami TaxID=75366 RepID=A0A672QWI6_SINGR
MIALFYCIKINLRDSYILRETDRSKNWMKVALLHRICCCSSKQKCLISQHHENVYSWFKQSLGEAPTCILSLYAETSTPTFYGDFKNDKKLSVLKRGNIFALTIKDAKPSDTGIYYCGARDYDLITFSCGLKEKCKSSYDPFNPGDSVNLHCSVLTKKCVGNHSVYWFKHESGDTHPGIIYKHGNMNDQCEKTSEKDSHVQSFIYNLPKKNLGLSDAGTYYCAVVTCGEILFGNGSRLEIGVYMNVCLRGTYCLSMVCFLFILPLGNQRKRFKRHLLAESESASHSARLLFLFHADIFYA